MPLYEYYCQHCDGIYEALRPMREASLPVPCPECHRDGQRIMSSFMAFTFRDGYPRRLPDKGTYWHLGKEVSAPATTMYHYEHPELYKPEPKPKPSKGERAAQRDRQEKARIESRHRDKSGVDKHGFTAPQARGGRKAERTIITPEGQTKSKP